MSLKTTFELIDKVSDRLDAISNAANTSFGAFQSGATSANSAISSATSNISTYQDAVSQSASATENYSNSVSTAAVSSAELSNANSSSAASLDSESEAAKSASESIEDYGESASKSSEESEEMGKKGKEALEGIGNLLTTLGIAKLLHEIAEGFKEAADEAMGFETSLAKVETLADTSTISMSEIKEQLLDLSTDTGQSANDLAEATYQAISASVDTADAVDFVSTSTQLAVGGFTSSASAVDVLTTALNSYKLESSEASKISDMLVTTQNLGKTTVDELASSVGKVIPLAAAYNVQMDNLSTGYAELTKNGIATAEAGTYLRGMLQELGDSSSSVSEILVSKTGAAFSELMNAGYSLGDVIGILGDAVDNDSTRFSNLWSNVRAGIGALSIMNSGADAFNTTLAAMQDSTGATSKAYNIMADTTEMAQARMNEAQARLTDAIGSQFLPVLSQVYEIGANAFSWVAGVVEEHPQLVSAVTAGAVALGVFTASITVFNTVVPLATKAYVAFKTAVTATNPVMLAVTAVTALVAGIATLVSMTEEATNEYDEYSASTVTLKHKIEETTAAHEKAVEKYGETSYQAQELSHTLSELQAEYNATSQSMEDHQAEIQSTIDSYQSMLEGHRSNIEAAETETAGVENLVSRLTELTDSSGKVTGSQEEVLTIVNALNNALPDLGLSYDSVTKSLNMTSQAIVEAAQAQAKSNLVSEYRNEITKAVTDQAKLNSEIAEQSKQVKNAKANYDNLINSADYKKYQSEWQAANEAFANSMGNEAQSRQAAAAMNSVTRQYSDLIDQVNSASEAYDYEKSKLEEKRNQYQETQDLIESTTTKIEDLNKIYVESGNAATDAANEAIDSVKAQLDNLAAAYDTAYQTALTSFDGQFGLFDKAKADSESTVSAAQAALDSQLSYWTKYSDNIEQLKTLSADKLNMSKEDFNSFMAYVQSGTEEAAGLAKSMVANINNGNTDAVEKLATTYSKVEEQQKNAAQQVADWKTEFSTKLAEIQKEMDTTVDKMDAADEAKAAAQKTIQSYIDGINSKIPEVRSAASAVRSATSSTLGSNASTFALPSLAAPGHASGTTDAEDVFIAGENGPELIVDHSGATVFPTSETEKIVNAVQGEKYYTPLSSDGDGNPIMSLNNNSGTSSTEKTINLNINGSGKIKADGNISKEDVVEIIMEQLEPIIVELLEDDIVEEGEREYVY